MEFGVATFATDHSMPVIDLGKAAEEHGFESLWLAEHTHIPVSRKTPWPGGAELPQEYWHGLDPFLGLTAVAAVTSRIRLGTGICLVIEHDVITLAKEVSTLDLISGGRFLFGIGGGWNAEEMANHGTAFATRFRLLRERVRALKEIWTKDEPEYHGSLVNFDPIWQWPKPVQKPHPPVIVGGDGPHTLARVVEYGDGWMPITGRGDFPIEDRLAQLNERAAAAGRGRIPVTAYLARADRATVERFEKAGVDRYVFGLPPAPADVVLPRIAKLADLANSFR